MPSTYLSLIGSLSCFLGLVSGRWMSGHRLLFRSGGRGGRRDDGLHRLSHHRAGRAAAARPDDELRREQFDHGPERRVRDPLDQPLAGALADAPDRLVDRGQRRVAQGGGVDVVKADQRDVIRHPDRVLGQGTEHADRHLVVGADDRVGQLAARAAEVGQHLLRRGLAAAHAEPSAAGADQLGARMRVDDRLGGLPPGLGVGRGLRPVDVEQPTAAVVDDQVAHQRVRARPVVRRHHVHAAQRRVAGHHDHRQPPGQPGQRGRWAPRPRR